MSPVRRAGTIAALLGAPLALAYRFALVYRARAGFPRRHPPTVTPADRGMPYEEMRVVSRGAELPGWFIPAGDGAAGPGVVLVHGWESARDRTLPNAQVLHAAGFHVLTVDVRGHGANPAETLPISGGEFGADAGAALDALLARPEVTRGALLGHSLGGCGALLAASADRRAAAVVSVSAPADPYRLTRLTFRLARLPLPDLIAYPLAALTTHVFVRPRRHDVRSISAARAAARYRGPMLLVHGELDDVVPVAHLGRLADAARAGRRTDAGASPVETHVVPGGGHSWLYEDEAYRRTVAAFLARALGGPLSPEEAAERAAAVDARRLPDPERRFSAVAPTHVRLRTLAEVVGAPVRRADPDQARVSLPPDRPGEPSSPVTG